MSKTLRAKRTRKLRVRRDSAMPGSSEQKTPGLYYPVMQPDEMFEQIGKLRQEAQIEIDRLIAFLDMTEDTDQDVACDDSPVDEDERESDGLEEGEEDTSDDESSLCGIHADDQRVDARDFEPDLGTPEHRIDQIKTAIHHVPVTGEVR